MRPANGRLYAVTDAARLYTLDATTGAATMAGMLSADAADATNPFAMLSGAAFGVDFNPLADRLRVVSDAEQNLRANVDTGATTTDATLMRGAFAVTAAAYTNNFARHHGHDAVRHRHAERPAAHAESAEQRHAERRRRTRHRRHGRERLRNRRAGHGAGGAVDSQRTGGALHDQSHDRRRAARRQRGDSASERQDYRHIGDADSGHAGAGQHCLRGAERRDADFLRSQRSGAARLRPLQSPACNPARRCSGSTSARPTTCCTPSAALRGSTRSMSRPVRRHTLRRLQPMPRTRPSRSRR